MSYAHYRRWVHEPLEEPPELSVVIPAYNEAERILPTIGAVAAYCCDLLRSWELIVVDDGSTDGTAGLVRRLHLANGRVLSGRNQGKGAAVRRGVLDARGVSVLMSDADLSTPIQQLGPMLRLVDDDEADVVVGSRAAAGSEVYERTRLRRALSACTASISRRVLALGVRDTQCGFKLFRAAAARQLFERQTIPGFAFDLEILFLARRAGLRVVEVPVEWHDAPGSKVAGLRDAARGARDLLRIRLHEQRGDYRDVAPRRALADCAVEHAS